ncbi:hypothetical protein HY251_15250 [bacterium]|nr:hypothetical protein [bacterium]
MIEAALGLLVAGAALVFRFAGSDREVEVQLWHYVTYTGAAFLAIGLVRDMILILKRGRTEKPRHAGEKLICFESVSGALLVMAGMALYLVGVERAWHPDLSWLGVYAGGLFVVSGQTKDVVMVFKREKDHANLIPW